MVTKIHTDPTLREFVFPGGRWAMHGSTQGNESKAHRGAVWGHCTSLVSSFSDPLSNAHLLKLSLVSTVSCSFWQLLYPTHTPYLPPHVYYQQITSPCTCLIDPDFQSHTSVSRLFSLQRQPSVATLVPLPFSSVWGHDISFFLVKAASPPTCLISFSRVTGPLFTVSLLHPLSSTPPH